jgi:hypothetical protein
MREAVNKRTAGIPAPHLKDFFADVKQPVFLE